MNATPPAVSGYLVVAAEDAGSTDARAVGQVLRVLAADAPAELRATAGPEDLDAALGDLAGRRLVVAGGDGTVHLVVHALLAAGLADTTPVGLVPLGTGNDLAHAVGVPADPAEAASRVVAGRVRALDLLRHADHLAVNAAHAGFGVAAAPRAQRLKPVLGVLAYRAASLWTGAVDDGVEATVAVDGHLVAESEPVMLVAVMNATSIGGNTPLCPAADLSDGLLDVVVVTDRGRSARAAFGAALIRGRHLALPGVTHRPGRRASVRVAGGAWNVDGELVRTHADVQWQVQPAAWRVVA